MSAHRAAGQRHGDHHAGERGRSRWITSGKTVAGITLPAAVDNGSMGIFAIAAG